MLKYSLFDGHVTNIFSLEYKYKKIFHSRMFTALIVQIALRKLFGKINYFNENMFDAIYCRSNFFLTANHLFRKITLHDVINIPIWSM